MKAEIDITFDNRFWAMLPALNLNFHKDADGKQSGITFEIEFLCFAMYTKMDLALSSIFVCLGTVAYTCVVGHLIDIFILGEAAAS